MSQFTISPKSFTAGEALAAFRRVKLSTTSAVYADQADTGNFIGFTLAAAASGEQVAVALKTAGQSFKAVAADSFSAGATLYAADDGKVSDTASGAAIGVAMEAAGADGDVVEVLCIAQTSVDAESLS